jgi:hypothetical protein
MPESETQFVWFPLEVASSVVVFRAFVLFGDVVFDGDGYEGWKELA